MILLNPMTILEETDIKLGDTVIDFGSGSGHWSIFAGKLVGAEGKVFAIKNNIEILKMLVKVADISSVHNIQIEEIDFEKEKSKISELADMVLVLNIFNSIKNRDFFIDNVAEFVKPTGELLFVDWDPERKEFGPKDGKRISKEEVIKKFQKIGLLLDREVEAGWNHFGLIFKRKSKKEDVNDGKK
ncbi:MAG: methyltransferase domain-containing protein [bacterium]